MIIMNYSWIVGLMDHIRKFCVAPMMGYTTPHARKLYRILSKKAYLFSEMIASKTLIHSTTRDLIIKNECENPIALQVGGNNIIELAECSKIAKLYNYDEINLNVGCPSKTVQKGGFGACLMKDKILVRNCLEAMMNAVDINVSIKCRIGIGKNFDYNFFYEFINEIIKSGINVIYVHARNAILTDYNTKNNRLIPPLNYSFITKIKNQFPQTQFILNGGIDSIEKAYGLSQSYDGVMVGRLIQNNPFSLSKVDNVFFKKNTENILYKKIIFEYFQYVKQNINNDSIFRLLSPLINIFFGIPNSKKLKSKIHNNILNHKIDTLENLFLKFFNNEKVDFN